MKSNMVCKEGILICVNMARSQRKGNQVTLAVQLKKINHVLNHMNTLLFMVKKEKTETKQNPPLFLAKTI